MDKLRKLAEEHSKELESTRLQDSITNAIGDRRGRDFLDYISELESRLGWGCVVDILVSAQHGKYSTPVTLGTQKRKVEPLKFREVLFGLFSHSGLEPVNVSTTDILDELRESESFVEANSLFGALIEDHIHHQIESGDLLFFSGDTLVSTIGKRIIQLQEDQVKSFVLAVSNGSIKIEKLWKTELGRRILADLGVKGCQLPPGGDVIQILDVSRPGLDGRQEEIIEHRDPLDIPSLPIYHRLLEAMVQYNIGELQDLGSQWASPVLDHQISESLKYYLENGNPEDYRQYLDGLNALIAVRATQSISTLQKLIERVDKPRISAPAALALGNFFHDSTVSILIETACSKLDETGEAALKSLERIHSLTPEAEPIIRQAATGDCQSARRLNAILQKRSWKPS
ncbi:hypothetical protein EU519_00230 [Candidatus Thorarchaeota archaeon]|nr:MAG: hypothetical protein EU519_00230 [Candidatus Thorarchaeota archaeon]